MEPIGIACRSYADEAQAGSCRQDLGARLATVPDAGTAVAIEGTAPPEEFMTHPKGL